jgi:hypothetical protein
MATIHKHSAAIRVGFRAAAILMTMALSTCGVVAAARLSAVQGAVAHAAGVGRGSVLIHLTDRRSVSTPRLRILDLFECDAAVGTYIAG